MTIFLDRNHARTLTQAWTLYPAAARIAKVTGGWMVFPTHTDYKTWRNQR